MSVDILSNNVVSLNDKRLIQGKVSSVVRWLSSFSDMLYMYSGFSFSRSSRDIKCFSDQISEDQLSSFHTRSPFLEIITGNIYLAFEGLEYQRCAAVFWEIRPLQSYPLPVQWIADIKHRITIARATTTADKAIARGQDNHILREKVKNTFLNFSEVLKKDLTSPS
nr:hypothetical protein Iba_chr14bCG12290 [Ipomoea batatas]GMD93555.1 hypothetical protein Iba_chr14fCG8560 [Ipomoea batatas]